MFIRIIVTMFIILVVWGTVSFNARGLTDIVSDRGKQLTISLVDKKLVEWYVNHDGVLPSATNSSLTTEQLEMMGLRYANLSGISYTRLADDRFQLRATLADGTVLSSVNSDKNLLSVHKESL